MIADSQFCTDQEIFGCLHAHPMSEVSHGFEGQDIVFEGIFILYLHSVNYGCFVVGDRSSNNENI